MAPDVGEVGDGSGEGDDVDGCEDGAFEREEEGHPDEVEAESVAEGDEGLVTGVWGVSID